jgi:hypothetical protein
VEKWEGYILVSGVNWNEGRIMVKCEFISILTPQTLSVTLYLYAYFLCMHIACVLFIVYVLLKVLYWSVGC